MKAAVLTIALIFGLSHNYTAQLNYNTAIGLRAGGTSGLTIKQALGGNRAFEGIIGVWNYGFTVTGLYEIYVPTSASGLNWYYGAGGHLAANTGYYYWYDSRRDKYYKNGGLGLGLDGVIGIEYKIPKAPIAFSLDLKPFIEFNNYGSFYSALDPGLGVKVAF
ncbi:MAG: hypothetical protein KJ941_12375 [Bacteroidetes bacterium]|nr:hypothetical protein [Bacteroidota bacterium]